MTTAELIAKLREIDPEGVEDVVVSDGGNCDYDATGVELVDEDHRTRFVRGGVFHVRFVRIMP